MKKLLEAINRGILKGLNELNIELISDLDDDELDLLDSILTKSVNSKLVYTYVPKTKEELVEIIKSEVERNGWECSLNHIDTRKITDMSCLFCGNDGYGLAAFNGDISRWNVSNVTSMHSMFAFAKAFNQPIGNWDVSNVENMNSMFFAADLFNQPIGNWNVSNVTNMESMFDGAYSFNQPIGDWDVSNVKYMDYMFEGAESFNQPIGDWDISNVESMQAMFWYAESFNQPIGDWDVSNVKYMEVMFLGAKSFNQDLSNWQIKDDCDTTKMFIECPIKEEYKPNGIE